MDVIDGAADTAAWLDTNRIPCRDLCFLGANPEADADAYIDDARTTPRHLTTATRRHTVPGPL